MLSAVLHLSDRMMKKPTFSLVTWRFLAGSQLLTWFPDKINIERLTVQRLSERMTITNQALPQLTAKTSSLFLPDKTDSVKPALRPYLMALYKLNTVTLAEFTVLSQLFTLTWQKWQCEAKSSVFTLTW
jgi:hypothetical protein